MSKRTYGPSYVGNRRAPSARRSCVNHSQLVTSSPPKLAAANWRDSVAGVLSPLDQQRREESDLVGASSGGAFEDYLT